MAAPYSPIIKNEDTRFRTCLEDFINPGTFKTTPTISSGDFKVDIDGVGFTLMGTLPSVSPTGSAAVLVALSASEMNGDVITVIAQDQTSPKEWSDQSWCFVTQAANQDVNIVSIATGAITSTHFAVGAIGPSAIATGAITDAKFAIGAIGPTAIATGAFTSEKFFLGAINATAVASGVAGLSSLQDTKLDEIHKRNGLDASNSLVVTFDTSGGTGTVVVGSVTQNVTKVGNITTVDRQ